MDAAQGRSRLEVKHQSWAAVLDPSTILETSIPALAIAFLTSARVDRLPPSGDPGGTGFLYPYYIVHPEVEPWNLRPLGSVAAVSYICAALYLGWRPPVPGVPAPVTQTSVSLYAITLFLGGLVAGAVAREIRKHVQSALREAETRQKLEAIQHDLSSAVHSAVASSPGTASNRGFDVAGWNQPADDTGGDYFDWTTLPNGRVVVSLADVTGHGIGPALLAAVCHAYARSNFSIAQDLPTAFEHINQELGADLTTGRFVTFVAAVCCPGCPEVEMLSAGHGPLFLYSRPEDRFTTMNAHALPFGILPGFQSDPPAHLQLQRGI